MHLRCQVHPAFMDPSPDFSQGWVQKTCQKMPFSGGMCESGVHFGCRQLVVSQRGFFLLGIKGHTEARCMLIHQYGTHLAIGWCERYEVSGFSVHYPVQPTQQEVSRIASYRCGSSPCSNAFRFGCKTYQNSLRWTSNNFQARRMVFSIG